MNLPLMAEGDEHEIISIFPQSKFNLQKLCKHSQVYSLVLKMAAL